MPNSFLSAIIEKKKTDVQTLYVTKGLSFFRQKAAENTAMPRFKTAMQKSGLNLIAEIKKASPSKGVIREDFDPIQLATSFQAAGAAALSVLTEPHFFLGKPEYIPKIKQVCQLPVLRKDFIIDPIQVYESKYLGADAILLIKAILDDESCQILIDLAQDTGLDVLLEIHNVEEFEQIRHLRNVTMVGVNNRDLKSFHMNMNLAASLLPQINSAFGQSVVTVAESGYHTADELDVLSKQGFGAVLIGEGLAKHPDLMSFFKP